MYFITVEGAEQPEMRENFSIYFIVCLSSPRVLQYTTNTVVECKSV